MNHDIRLHNLPNIGHTNNQMYLHTVNTINIYISYILPSVLIFIKLILYLGNNKTPLFSNCCHFIKYTTGSVACRGSTYLNTYHANYVSSRSMWNAHFSTKHEIPRFSMSVPSQTVYLVLMSDHSIFFPNSIDVFKWPNGLILTQHLFCYQSGCISLFLGQS